MFALREKHRPAGVASRDPVATQAELERHIASLTRRLERQDVLIARHEIGNVRWTRGRVIGASVGVLFLVLNVISIIRGPIDTVRTESFTAGFEAGYRASALPKGDPLDEMAERARLSWNERRLGQPPKSLAGRFFRWYGIED